MDYGTWSFQESASTQSSVGRDTGFQAMGYLAGDHLKYRAGVYSGFRAPGVKNSFRFTGRLMYDVFDVEKGQFYAGTYFGKKKVLAFGASYDTQSDYNAYAGDVFFDYPVGDNGITAQADYIHYDGGVTFNTAALFKQDDLYAEAGFFIKAAKVMPFFRYEQQRYSDNIHENLDKTSYQGGLGWYPYGSNLNFKAGATRREFPNDRRSPRRTSTRSRSSSSTTDPGPGSAGRDSPSRVRAAPRQAAFRLPSSTHLTSSLRIRYESAATADSIAFGVAPAEAFVQTAFWSAPSVSSGSVDGFDPVGARTIPSGTRAEKRWKSSYRRMPSRRRETTSRAGSPSRAGGRAPA